MVSRTEGITHTEGYGEQSSEEMTRT